MTLPWQAGPSGADFEDLRALPDTMRLLLATAPGVVHSSRFALTGGAALVRG